MAKIIDLGVLVQEPLIFVDKDGEEYTIPGEISTKLMIKISHYNQEVQKIKDEEEAIEKLLLIVVDILNLDKSKNVTLETIYEKFDNVKVLNKIVSEVFNHITEISSDPNSNTPESE